MMKKFHTNTISQRLTQASRLVPAADTIRAYHSSMARSLLVGMLLGLLLWPASGARLATGLTTASTSAATLTQTAVPCQIEPNRGRQAATVSVTLTLGPDVALNPLALALLLFQPELVLNATTVSFRPAGIQARLFQVSLDPTGKVTYTGAFVVDSNAEVGPRDVTLRADLSPLGGPVLEYGCSRAFTVEGGGFVSFYNGPPIFTLPMENPSEPPCGCRAEPSYSRGIGQVEVAERCGRRRPPIINILYQGISNDAGAATVFLHNGEFNHMVTDLEIPGRGFNWKFERKYRSGVIFEGPLGHNWEFNYNRRLFVQPDGAVVRMDGYGRADRYELVENRYVSPNGFYTTLVRNRDGSFTERDRSGTTVTYAVPFPNGLAPMTSLSDRDGNTMRFIYNDLGQLVRVLDTLGRPIEYRYNADTGRLIEVQDFAGRSIKFSYDGDGNLVAVTSPAVTGTPTAMTSRRAKLNGTVTSSVLVCTNTCNTIWSASRRQTKSPQADRRVSASNTTPIPARPRSSAC